MYKVFSEEILYPSDEIKNRKKYLVPSMFIYMYCSSVLFSCIFIHFTNQALDFFPKESHRVTIVDSRHYTTGSGKTRKTHYELTIDPSIHRLKIIDVSYDFYKSVKDGDDIRLYCCRGLWGQRYISNKMYLVEKKK